jgi:hypothetical protein
MPAKIISSFRFMTARPFTSQIPAFRLLTSILWILASGACLPVFAQSVPKLTATLEPAEIRPGSSAAYTITIENGKPDETPGLNLPDGVSLASDGTSYQQRTSIINGAITRTTSIGWQITSDKTGDHVIAPQQLHIGGVPYATNEVRLVVKEDASSPSAQLDPLMTIETAKREFYVGEVVPITVNLYVHRRTLLRRVGLIELPKDSFAIQRFPLQADENTVNMGGVPYRSLAFQSTLSALKPGKFKLGPATSEIILDVPSSDDRFQNPLFMQTEQRKVNPSCNEIDVTVLPLPTEGKPKNFSGVVGDFEISMTADPRSLSVGDPIAVELTITGSGNFDALTAPQLTEAAAWKTYPPRRFNVGSSNTPTLGQQSIGFNQVIIPKEAVRVIPSFEFSYFSPTKKEYLTLRTPPVPLEIKVAETPVESPPASKSSASSTGPAAPDVEKVPQAQPKITDILTSTAASAAWLQQRPALWQDRQFLLANFGAAGALLLLIASKLGVMAWRSHQLHSNTPASKLWREMGARDLPSHQFYHLAAAFIQEKQLSGESIQPILDRHETLNYSRTSEDALKPIDAEERAKVLSTLKA